MSQSQVKLIDLSHTVEAGMITYKGLPAPIICDFLSREASRAIYAEGTEFHIGKIEMVANTGTYIDSPFHRFADGIDLKAKAVLVHTGWSRHWRTDHYFEGHTYLTEGAAIYLRDQGAALVGIDSYNIDDIRDGRRPVHTTLLGAQIPIVEHMTNLGQLPDQGFRFHAAPVKVKNFGTFPVRAYAVVE
jgi:arylformamidase